MHKLWGQARATGYTLGCVDLRYIRPPNPRSLEGKLGGQHGKGLVDMCLFKKALLGHLLGTVMGAFTWDESIKDNIREAFRSTQDCRNKC